MSDVAVVRFAPRGAARTFFTARDPEVLLCGPAGTGKTRAALEKLHLQLSKYPGARAMMCRKTHASLTATALQTYQRKVLHAADGVTFYGGSAAEPPQFRYPNGSRLYMGGLDKPTKVMSGEYDIAYANEATELTENDWESLTTRLRHGVLPYQQLLADCNPGAPSHWLRQRANAGTTRLLDSRYEDNPEYWDGERDTWTPVGAAYIAKLDALTGVRHLRLRKGIWAAAEGMVYDGWDTAVHLVDTVPGVAPDAEVDARGIPRSWPRYLSVDFGFTNPFVAMWAAEDPDGRLIRYREIYRTHRLVEDHAADILRLMAPEPRPVAIICDHDAEGRATLERHLGLPTRPAYKKVAEGIQAVAARLRPAGDGLPRLFLLRDSLVERDPDLADAKKPTCTEEEIEGYVWSDKVKKDEPVKVDDHGADCLRYLVAHQDCQGGPAVDLGSDPEPAQTDRPRRTFWR